MKRRHYFELEDQPWFPRLLRAGVTRYIAAFHRLIGSTPEVADLAARALEECGLRQIHDFGSGHGGPQAAVLANLRARPGLEDVELQLSDLYPPPDAEAIGAGVAGLSYRAGSVDAADPGDLPPGLRTMICSLHHLRPEQARSALSAAAESRQPFLAYEISDNSAPAALWWTTIPFAALLAPLVTLMVRPLRFSQLLLTYLVPILPLCIGWDGAVSNARTYGQGDLDELLAEIPSEGYRWEHGTLGSGPAKRLYLLGLPVEDPGIMGSEETQG